MFANGTHGYFGNAEAANRFMMNYTAEGTHFSWHVATHLFLLQGMTPDFLLPGDPIAFVGAAWSLSLEWQFYVLAPILCFIASKRNGFAMVAIIVTLIITGAYIYSPQLRLLYPMQSLLPQKLSFFWIGMLSYELHRLADQRNNVVAEVLFVGVAPLVYIFTLSLPLAIWAAVIGASLSNGQSRLSGYFMRFLCLPFLQYLGRLSYVTYLSHAIFLCIVGWSLQRLFPTISQGAFLTALIAATFTVTLVFSGWIHTWLEVPAMRLGRRLTSS